LVVQDFATIHSTSVNLQILDKPTWAFYLQVLSRSGPQGRRTKGNQGNSDQTEKISPAINKKPADRGKMCFH
jgi:hypothetical protein